MRNSSLFPLAIFEKKKTETQCIYLIAVIRDENWKINICTNIQDKFLDAEIFIGNDGELGQKSELLS